MTYGCNTLVYNEPQKLAVTSNQFPENVWPMRMSLDCRYDKREIDTGCLLCKREWDTEYLTEKGLL